MRRATRETAIPAIRVSTSRRPSGARHPGDGPPPAIGAGPLAKRLSAALALRRHVGAAPLAGPGKRVRLRHNG
jgi:hypothetical protein